jgi:hypothetical protein
VYSETVWEGIQLYRDVERLDLLLARRSLRLEEIRQEILEGGSETDRLKFEKETERIRREFDAKRETYLGDGARDGAQP